MTNKAVETMGVGAWRRLAANPDAVYRESIDNGTYVVIFLYCEPDIVMVGQMDNLWVET